MYWLAPISTRTDPPCPYTTLFRSDHFCDEAGVLRLRGVEAVPGQEQFGGARIAEYFLEQPGAAIARNDADLDETAREFRAFRGDADIAGAGQVAAQADCVAVEDRKSTRLNSSH